MDVPVEDNEIRQVFEQDGLRVGAVPVHHGPIPALAWRVDIADKSLVFSGDMNGDKRKRVRRLMRKMGLVSVAPKPNTSRPAPQHNIYPDLLRGLEIDRPDQVWCADTGLPVRFRA